MYVTEAVASVARHTVYLQLEAFSDSLVGKLTTFYDILITKYILYYTHLLNRLP